MCESFLNILRGVDDNNARSFICLSDDDVLIASELFDGSANFFKHVGGKGLGLKCVQFFLCQIQLSLHGSRELGL